MYTTNSLLFPHSSIVMLRGARGDDWRSLVDHVVKLPERHEETLAFMLTLVRLNGCVPCETDSFRAMRGCVACAVQTLRRYKGTDSDLIAQFEQAICEVRLYAAAHPQLSIETQA